MPKKTTAVPITALKHNDKRANIPTEELRDFVVQEETHPYTLTYPRDTSLDPQLVWRGKDDQDAQPLAVPVVPVYIQEKIQPQAIIENVRASVPQAGPMQPGLFADFNTLPFDKLVDFYHYGDKWANRLILGDSLLVMTSLAEKEVLKGQVQMIYIDPPYGIKFGSNWQVSTRKRDVKDGRAEDATRQPEQIKAYRDTWELGIHSYLSYLRDRLIVARELLSESGSVFVQIGDENVHLVRCVMDEVFGSENFVSLISFRTTSSLGGDYLGKSCDYVLWYARTRDQLKYRQLHKPRGYEDDIGNRFTRVQLPNGTRRVLTTSEREDISTLPDGSSIYRHDNLTSQSGTEKSQFLVSFEGQKFKLERGHWKTNEPGMSNLARAARLAAPTQNSLTYIRFLEDFPLSTFSNIWTDTQTGAFTDPKVYVVQTNTKVIERCLLMTTDPGDLVLDPTSGSGTTAYVAEQWGRRWMAIDTSRVAIALARTRLMAARYPYYTLLDSPDGARKEAELAGRADLQSPAPAYASDVKKGFVYKRVPHITLKSIANNAEIDAIHAKWQADLDPLRAQLNRLLKQSWEEWQVPRDPDPTWPAKAVPLHEKWWQLRRQRQAEIDASIARHADTELLFDQPYEDNKRVRVAGPFTVESLSPHRVLAADEERPTSETTARQADAAGGFVPMILANLRAAGVQNTVKQERLKFDRLEPYAGIYLHATGEYTETSLPSPTPVVGEGPGVRATPEARAKRVAVSIGPEHGTVGPEQIKEAAKEAVQGVGHDLLIVCGFAFDPHVTEEAKRYGKLTVLIARMNPDLAMGDELLKKTGAGNLFMVFGEPDLTITKQPDGMLVVALNGVDVYDPTTGQIRSHSTDDIACWFIDTDYNGESFFVRHAYFTGAGDPYERLKRALRADIDEGAWSKLYSTTSYPFDPPHTGKIAVKVINHYGDEVLKVYTV